MTTTVSLLTLDTSKPYVSSTFLPGDARHAWDWIASLVAAEHDCLEEEVHCLEDETGGLDVVTAAGVPVARVVIEWRPNLH